MIGLKNNTHKEYTTETIEPNPKHDRARSYIGPLKLVVEGKSVVSKMKKEN